MSASEKATDGGVTKCKQSECGPDCVKTRDR